MDESAEGAQRMKRLALWGILPALLVGCSSEGVGSRESPSQREAVEELDPLDQASVAFIGNPSRRSIKTAMDIAFAATGTPTTDENYSRAGSALVTFRKKSGGTEMETLRCIPGRVGDPRIPDSTFASVAALCSLTTTGALP
jgi:hypothetical protein